MGILGEEGERTCTIHKIQRQVWPVEAPDRKIAAVRQVLMGIDSNKDSVTV